MDRLEFAKRLHDVVLPSGTSPEDMQNMMFPVPEAIFQMMPRSLYRYRSCNEMQIEAFKNVGLYPVIYDEERMDVSLYMTWSFLWLIGIKANNPDVTAYLKIALHKSSIWAYEQEWRMIDLTPRNVTDTTPSEIHYKPTAIYYGQHISTEHKAELHAIAQEKGIKEYEMFIDYTSPKYEMKWRGMES